MPRYALTIAYDGADFHGWQRQTQPAATLGEPPVELRTVQGELESALRHVIRAPVSALGASRTDAGVHAAAQVAVFDASDDRVGPPDERLSAALNARLSADVRILACRRVRNDFDPIRDCLAKGYRYTLSLGDEPPLWDRRFAHHIRDRGLDLPAMRAAAERLVGEHDFAAFASAGHGRESTVRTVLHCAVSQTGAERMAIDVSGDGFLYNMARIIAGTLVEVGRGRKTIEDVRAALASGERERAGPTLPPTGLRLEWIRYPAGVFARD